MNLKNLQEALTSAANLNIHCFVTKKSMFWNDARRAGWKYNTDGVPFSSDNYFSPEGLQQLKEAENKT